MQTKNQNMITLKKEGESEKEVDRETEITGNLDINQGIGTVKAVIITTLLPEPFVNHAKKADEYNIN